MKCLQNGKSVLCEKPMGMNADEVQKMINEAKSRNLFLMEGIWTRFIPAIEKLVELINNNVIGDINFIRADFGFKAEFDPESRVFNKKLGGGSLLDIGIYPVYLSLLMLGIPTNIKGMARMAKTGVDNYCSMLFNYENSAKANLESTFEADTSTEAYIYGSKGTLKLHNRFHHTEKMSLFRDGKLVKEFNIKYIGNGYFHEIEEVNKCLKEGKIESIKLSPMISLELIKILDRVRTEIGLNY